VSKYFPSQRSYNSLQKSQPYVSKHGLTGARDDQPSNRGFA